ncbi:MAG: UDP-2,3-diacylglucosamine diphosphatase [Melioribacteraceae bacterium]|nr:UDP-2,3-diacylglucosamine diphosphatase [Melioribacteraceae bacterium]
MKNNHYFISDLHFGLLGNTEEVERELIFVEFLNSIQDSAKALYILGDLFDYWFEYKKVIQKGYFRTFTALNDLVRSGTKVHYLIGNHDFMHRDFFENEVGVKLYQEDIEVEIENKKFYLAHGDGLVKNDYGYLLLKKVFRSKLAQNMYSLIHPNLGIKIAKVTSKTSRDHTGNKDYGEDDGLFQFAKTKIDTGFDYVILGHTHKEQVESYKTGTYVNLGTWLDKPMYGIYENGKFDLRDWK